LTSDELSPTGYDKTRYVIVVFSHNFIFLFSSGLSTFAQPKIIEI